VRTPWAGTAPRRTRPGSRTARKEPLDFFFFRTKYFCVYYPWHESPVSCHASKLQIISIVRGYFFSFDHISFSSIFVLCLVWFWIVACVRNDTYYMKLKLLQCNNTHRSPIIGQCS
jgi:hypothetical protein